MDFLTILVDVNTMNIAAQMHEGSWPSLSFIIRVVGVVAGHVWLKRWLFGTLQLKPS